MKWIRALLFVLLMSIAATGANAQTTSQPANQPGAQLKVYLLTFGPGSDAWEKFGHDAIVIDDNTTGTSTAYNWGVFNFGEGVGGFISFGWHFVQGRLHYSMQSEPTDDMFDEYKQNNRSIFAQELNLTPAQKLDLQNRLIANDTDANRYYLYDYFRKNCATMARDAIDQTVDGRVRTALENVPTGTTYRWHDRRDCADTIWLYLFLDYALGRPIDQPLSAWQECFLPGKLADHLESVTVPDAQGKLVPLVSASKQLNAGMFPERTAPPAYFIYGFLGVGVGIGLLIATLGSIGHRYKVARWSFNLLGTSWSLFAGSLGLLLTLIWFTNHEAAKWNENWFQVNPISLLLIVLLPAARRWPSAARSVAFIALGAAAFGLLAKLTPWAMQLNGPTMAIALPIHAGILWGIVRLQTNRKDVA